MQGPDSCFDPVLSRSPLPLGTLGPTITLADIATMLNFKRNWPNFLKCGCVWGHHKAPTATSSLRSIWWHGHVPSMGSPWFTLGTATTRFCVPGLWEPCEPTARVQTPCFTLLHRRWCLILRPGLSFRLSEMPETLVTPVRLKQCLDFLLKVVMASPPMVLRLCFLPVLFDLVGPLGVRDWCRTVLVRSVFFILLGMSCCFVSSFPGVLFLRLKSLTGLPSMVLSMLTCRSCTVPCNSLDQWTRFIYVYLRCHLDGTLFTQNGRAKFDATVSAKCPWCPAKDGFHHRAWECPHFAPCRSHFTSEQLGVIDTFPSCLIDHGWPLVLPEWEVFFGFLLTADGLSRMSPVVPPVASDVAVELFMDGTGAFPREPKLRYAAWAVTLVPGGVGTLDNHLILGGNVGGICQTSYRAELTAVLAAIQWATQRGQSVRLWGDCQGVVTGVRRLLRGLPLKRNRPHSDLWERPESLLGTMDTGMVQICKVVSHGQIAMATGPLEEWAYWHNQLTDLAAAEINKRRSSEFWTAWEGLARALDFHRALHGAILKMLLQSSWMAAGQNQTSKLQPFQVPNDEVNVVVPQSWTVPAKLVQRYGHVNMQHLHDWWSQSGTSMLQGDGQLVFISGIQIFVAFNLCTQYPGPWCHKKRWYASGQDAPVAARVPWGARCQWFLRMWKSYVKANQVLIPTRMTRPCSASVARWTVCYRMRWNKRLLDEVDTALFAQHGRQITSNCDVACLNAARTG